MAFPDLGTFSAPGAQNVYIPGYMGDDAAQKRLMIGFTFNEESYALNNYITVYGADKQRFYYQRWNNSDFVRVPQSNGYDMVFADGADRPLGDEKPRFTHEPVELTRYGVRDHIGDMVEEFSDMGSFIPMLQDKYAGRMMLLRALLTMTELTTAANYPSGHHYATYGALTAAAATPLGYSANYFGAPGVNTILDGTMNDPLIKKVVTHAIKLIGRKSNNRVKPSDLMIVMNPNTADRLASTQEIRVIQAQQVNSIDLIHLKGDTPIDTYGLPRTLYGLKVFIDGTVYTSAKQDHVNNDTVEYVFPDATLSIVARPGAVQGMPNSAPIGSLSLWQHKKWAMKPSTSYDADNFRTKVMFTDMFVVKLTAAEITFTVQGLFTP